MAAAKKQFRCAQCGKQTSTSYAVRAKARLCGTCWPDIDMPRPLREKSASARPVAASAKRRRAAKPVVEAVAASVAAKPVAPAKGKKAAVPAPAQMGEAKPAAVPSAVAAGGEIWPGAGGSRASKTGPLLMRNSLPCRVFFRPVGVPGDADHDRLPEDPLFH